MTSLHDINQAIALGEKFFFMKNGTIRHAGGPETVTESVLKDVFDADVRIAEIDGKKIAIHGGLE